MFLALLLAAQDVPATPSAETPPTPAAPAAPAPAANLEEREPGLSFSYSWPGDVQDIPALQSMLEGRRDRARLDARQAAADRPADESGRPRPPYDFGTTWTRLGRTPQLLVLRASHYAFTGGAHGETNFEPLIWDIARGDTMSTSGLFGPPDWLDRFVARYCAALTGLRASRREDAATPAPEQPAAEPQDNGARPDAKRAQDTAPAPEPAAETCPPIGTLVVLPVDSNDNGRFDRLRVFIPPVTGAGGAAAQPSFEPEIPFTRADLALIAGNWSESFEASAPPPQPRRTRRTQRRR